MKRNEILGEHKKGVRAVKYNAKPKTHAEPSKPTNPVAKNASAAIGGGAAGAHKDAKKSSQAVRGQKHKAQPEMAEGYNPNSASAEHRRKLDQSHAADLKARAEGPDATERDQQRYQNYLDKKEQMANDYNDRMEREDIEQEALYRRRGSSSAYDRDYASSVSGMGRGNDHRDDERHDLDPSDWYIVKDGKMYKTSVYPRDEQEARTRGYSPSREQARARADADTKSTDEAMGADVGKITKVDPATQKATLTKPDGTSMEVDSTALKPTPDGKMSMDTPDAADLKTGTAVVSTEAADVPYPVKQGPEPTAIVHRTGGRGPGPLPIVASNPDWTEITPEFARKIGASTGTRYIMLHVEGQMVPALLGVNKITVVPSDYQKITANPRVKEAADVPYQVKQGPQPMAMTSPKPTPIVASKKWTAITPEIELKAVGDGRGNGGQGFRKVMLKVNGQLVPGLEGGDQVLGSKIIVAPSDFENMTRTGNAGTARRPMGVQSAEKTGIGAPPLRESDKVLLDKMLTIAGLR
jgi:hypothetical protein